MPQPAPFAQRLRQDPALPERALLGYVWPEQALLELIHRAAPYAELDERHYQALVQMLCDGYNGRQGIRSAYLHRDAVTGTLRGRRGARLTAVTSGGTIPDNADYSAEYLAEVRLPGGRYLSIPFADDVELSMRLG